MSELISLFRKIAAEPGKNYANRNTNPDEPQPAYFQQLLEYLKQKRREQGQALRAAISALAEAE